MARPLQAEGSQPLGSERSSSEADAEAGTGLLGLSGNGGFDWECRETQSPHGHQHQVRKELAAEPFERFTKLMDKLKAAKNVEEALLCLLKAQARLCDLVCQLRCCALATVVALL